jgi:hypothetical protein
MPARTAHPSQPVAARAGAAALIALIAGQAWAQSSASYQISRQSIDGGGGAASSAAYLLDGSIGQADAGAPATSASYQVRGGFQRAATGAAIDTIFANGFEN